MAVSQLAYLGIGVSDMDAWKTFATDILGMQIIERADDGTVYLRMDENHHRIALHPSGEDDVLYIGLQTPTTAEYEATKAALKAAGVATTQGSQAEIAHRRLIDFVKFETGGLPFELSIGPNTRWDPPFQPARPMAGFKTGQLGLGHVVLRSTDRDESARLLINTLGFRVSDYIGTMVFLHCNPRHHSVAFQPSIKDLPRSRDKKMWHFQLETNTLDDVGTALDLANRAGRARGVVARPPLQRPDGVLLHVDAVGLRGRVRLGRAPRRRRGLAGPAARPRHPLGPQGPARAGAGHAGPCSPLSARGRFLTDLLRAGDVERVVDQRLDAREEAHRMRQDGVIVERRFILPARMNVEQLWVPRGPIRVNVQAAWFRARRRHVLKDRLRDGGLVAGPRVESREDEQLHRG